VGLATSSLVGVGEGRAVAVYRSLGSGAGLWHGTSEHSSQRDGHLDGPSGESRPVGRNTVALRSSGCGLDIPALWW